MNHKNQSQNTDNGKLPFWHTKSFENMTNEEWESLCDCCGKCCLHKLEDEDTGQVYYTSVACRLLDIDQCRCISYENRFGQIHDCLMLKRKESYAYKWLPLTCAYRLIANGQDLYRWHPLVSEDPETVHISGISVKDKAVSENNVNLDDLEAYVLDFDI